MSGAPPEAERCALAPGYAIPRIIAGAWQLSEGHSARAVTRDALWATWDLLAAHGLDTLDCADIYTGVEELIGDYRAARAGRRVQVHTKFVPDRDALASVDRAYVTLIIERSLRRLRAEALDLVQFHWWRYEVAGMVEVAGILDDLRRAGKIRHLALTNTDTAWTRTLLDAGIPLVATQVQYSVLDRRPARALAPFVAGRGVHLLCYGSVAGGFLGEAWRGAEAPTGALENRSLTKYRLVIEECGGWAAFQRLLVALADIGARHGVGIANVAQRWVLDQSAVGAVVVGFRSESSAARAAATLALRLTPADHAELASVLADLPVPAGDVYAAERDPSSPHAGIIRYNLNSE
ncbi:MAG: aldo/keto reductase [Gemmatimonadales bacterium]|nr:aldo/keto reductase [Gemmatimonadales bacterium]